MITQETAIKDLLVLMPSVFEDNRGYFMESYNAKTLEALNIRHPFVQDNEAKSAYGVIRGLHFQTGEFAQTKLVRVIYGEILDVVIDLRTNSPYYGKSYQIELSDQNKKQLLVPKGFAHGYAVLSASAIVCYKCDAFYSKQHEQGIHLFDQTLRIDWRIPEHLRKTTAKDIAWPQFTELINGTFGF